MELEIDLVLTTAPDRDAASEIVRTLVGERHAACGNVAGSVTSIYWWEGAVQHADEVLVLLKTARPKTPVLLARARDIHPYDVPELIVLPVATGDRSYLEWVVRETSGGGGDEQL